MPAVIFPAFPDDVPVHPLIAVDYELIKARDANEIDKLWEAANRIGFWYMYNHGTDEEVNAMYDMSAETMALPMEEKLKFDQGSAGSSFGYKAAGTWQIDEKGSPDSAEFMNISKDDVLAYPRTAHRTYPSAVNNRMASTIKPFVSKSLAINDMLLEVFNERLGLPAGTLLARHTPEEHSGTEVRCIRNPPRQTKMSHLGAHTDFGSITLLHNRLGGLQVLVPGSDSWQYVKPIPGHMICNIGDAMTLFSGGLLRSNMHRVMAPPGAQAQLERWSLAFLVRPGNSVALRALAEDSPIVARAVVEHPGIDFEPGVTAGEWFTRRIKYQHIKNRKGTDEEAWLASKGTEHNLLEV